MSVDLARGQQKVDVCVTVRRDDAELVRDFVHAADEADRLSRTGQLLRTAAPIELSDARDAYLRRILAQLSS